MLSAQCLPFQEYRKVFRPLAIVSFALFALGLVLKLLYYAVGHLWSDLILQRRAGACCLNANAENEEGEEDLEGNANAFEMKEMDQRRCSISED